MKITLISLILTLSFSPLLAQVDTIKVTADSKVLNGTHIKPYSNKWKVYGVDKDGNKTFQRIWTDYIQIIDIDGIEFLSRTQELYSPEMSLQEVWTNLFERKTMLPKRASQMRLNGTYLYQEFDGKTVKVVQKQDKTDPKETVHQYNIEPFDWTLYGVLLSGLPLKAGWTASFPTVNFANPESPSWLGLKVESKVQLTTEDGRKYQTLKVVTDRGLTFWLSTKAPYVIQLELLQPAGQKILWVMY